MRLILDSHTLIWAVDDPTKLSAGAQTILTDPANRLVVSVATFTLQECRSYLRHRGYNATANRI